MIWTAWYICFLIFAAAAAVVVAAGLSLGLFVLAVKLLDLVLPD